MKTDKERVRELLKKVWLEGYTEDNEGVSQCEQDMEYIEDYIAYLEGIEEKYEYDTNLFAAILNKIDFEYALLTDEEIKNNETYISIGRYPDVGKVTVTRIKPQRYYNDEELKNENTD